MNKRIMAFVARPLACRWSGGFHCEWTERTIRASPPMKRKRLKAKVGKKKRHRFDWRTTSAVDVATRFLGQLGQQDYQGAYEAGRRCYVRPAVSRSSRPTEADGLNGYQSVEFSNGVPAKDGCAFRHGDKHRG